MVETDLISRQAAIDALKTDASFVMFDDHGNYTADGLRILEVLTALPSAQPDKTYEQGWKDGREALRKEKWEDGRDRLD